MVADRLRRATERGLRDAIDEMFTESQRIVNVDRGTLKKSGYHRFVPGGAIFGYRTPYAAAVNNGVSDHDERVRGHAVRSHRRLQRGSVRFGGRSYRYSARKRYYVKGGKFGQVKGYYVRTYDRHVAAREGSHYMERAIDSVMPRIGQIVGRRLRLEFSH